MTQLIHARSTGIPLAIALSMTASMTALMAASASAQEAPPAAEAPQSAGDIVVTAQKREQRLQNVPIAVTAVSGTALTGRQIFDTMQLPEIAPSLQTANQPHQASGVSGSIRGIGTAVFSDSVESSVSTVIDGVSYGRPDMAVVQLFDLSRVEVLEGPQGMLFGKNASAGVVSIVTRDPKLGVVEGTAHFEYGNSSTPGSGNEALAQVAVNIPVSQDSALRLAGFTTYRDPLVKNIYTSAGDYGQSEFGLRAKYVWEPNAQWRILLGGDIAHDTGAGLSAYTNGKMAPGGFLATETQKYAPQIPNTMLNDLVADDVPKYLSFTAMGLSADITYKTPSGISINNLFAARWLDKKSGGDVDHLPVDIFNINFGTDNDKQISDELKVTSPAGNRLEYVAGLYLFRGIYNSTFNQGGDLVDRGVATPPTGEEFIGNFDSRATHSNSVAAYGQATWHVFDPLRLTLGGRVTHDTLNDYGVFLQGPNEVALSALGAYNYYTNATALSYKAGIQYDVAHDVMVYGSYTRGYKGPGLANNPGIANPVVRREIPTAWEIGIKSQFFDRRLTLNLSAWDETFRDFQAQAYAGFSSATVLLNAGNLKSRGVEFEVAGNPVAGLSLHANGAYVDAYYKSFQGNPCYPGEATGTSGSNVCLANGTSDATGNQLQNSPKFTYTLSGQYDRPISDKLGAFFSANWYHKSSSNFNANEDPNTEQRGYGLLGGSLGIKAADDKWKVAIFARNLLDKRFAGWLIENPIDAAIGDSKKGGDYLTFFTPDSFRTIGATFDMRF